MSVQEVRWLLSGYRGDAGDLSYGGYSLAVAVESYRCTDRQRRIVLREHEAKPMVLSPNARPGQGAGWTQQSIDFRGGLTNGNSQEARTRPLPEPPGQVGGHPGDSPRFTGLPLAAADRVDASAVPDLLTKLDDCVGAGTRVAAGRPNAPFVNG